MKYGKMLLAFLLILLLWISWDLFVPSKSDFRQFDPEKIGRLETAMWRSYYERKPLQLFFLLASTLRVQFRAPFWRSQLLAFYAAKAAVTFQKGDGRTAYDKALPDLRKYYSGISNLSEKTFDVASVATNELEWWIIRREPDLHSPSDWERLIAQNAAEVYHLPVEKMNRHAMLRVEAMIKRDRIGGDITENDWMEIEQLLIESWESLFKEVNEF